MEMQGVGASTTYIVYGDTFLESEDAWSPRGSDPHLRFLFVSVGLSQPGVASSRPHVSLVSFPFISAFIQFHVC